MNTEKETLSTEEIQQVQEKIGYKYFSVNLSIPQDIYEFLDKCFQMFEISWEQFVSDEIDKTLESIATGGSCWLGEKIQDKLKEIKIQDKLKEI